MITLLALVALAQDPLRWKLAAGDDLTYEHTIDQTFKLTQDGSSFDYAQKVEITERLVVDRATIEGNFELRTSLSRVRVSVQGRLVYDSDAPDKFDRRSIEAFEGLVTKPQSVTVSPAGKLVGRRGASMQERLQRTLGGTADGAEPEAPIALVALPLPDGAERSWSVNEEQETEGAKLVSTTSYRRDGDVVSGDIALTIAKAPATLKLREGAGRHRVVFDGAGGCLRESTSDFAVTVENTVDGRPVRVASKVASVTKLKERTRK